MKYLCLVYSEEKVLDAMSKDEFAEFSDAHVALDEEIKRSGHSIAAEALQPVQIVKPVAGGLLDCPQQRFAWILAHEP